MLKLYKPLFLSLAVLAISSTSAYAKVDSCPSSATIQFDTGSHEWRTATYPWRSESKPRNVANLGKVKLEAVKLAITTAGDVPTCTYKAENGEEVVFTKGASAVKTASKNKVSKAVSLEIMPIPAHDRKVWPNDKVKNEFECKPSATQPCQFDDLTVQQSGNDYKLGMLNSMLTERLIYLDSVLTQFKTLPLDQQCASQFTKLRDSVLSVVDVETKIRESGGWVQDEMTRIEGTPDYKQKPALVARLAELQEFQTWLVDVPLGISKINKDNVKATIDEISSKCKLPTAPQ